MYRKDSPQSVIDSYRRRQQMTPLYLTGAAVVLVVIGIIILLLWFRGGNTPQISFLASATPTATETATPTPPTPTATITSTATETLTPTITQTVTPSGPFEYEVQADDNCWNLAVEYEVSLDVLLTINGFEPGTCPIGPGNIILIPLPDTKLPTITPYPTGRPGEVIEYTVMYGDTLATIADYFNTTVDAIVKANDVEDINVLVAGAKIKVPAFLVTPTATKAATNTSEPGSTTQTPDASETSEPATATVTKTP